MTRNRLCEELKKPISIKSVFMIAFALGILCHMAMYTQFYLGHDANTFYNSNARWDLIMGRFAGTYVKKLHNSLQMPWMIGIISNLFIATSIAIMASILRIKRMVPGVMLAIVTVTWPSVTSYHGYLYMLTQFSFAMLTSVLSVYVIERWNHGWLFSVGLSVISLGCYQSYIGLTAVLMLLRIVQECVSGGSVKRTVVYGVRCLSILIVSLGLYYWLWQLLMDVKGYEATAYRNMNTLGYEYILVMFSELKYVYKYVYDYFMRPFKSYMPFIVRLSIISAFVIATIGIYRKIYKNGERGIFEKLGRVVLCSVCYLLFPLGMNTGHFLGRSEPGTQMEMAFILPVLLAIMVCDESIDNRKHALKGYNLISAASLFICVFLSGYNGTYGANACYLKLKYNHESALVSVSQTLNVISAEERYTLDTPVVLLGDYEDIPYRTIQGFEWCDDVTGMNSSSFTYGEPMFAIFRQYCPALNIVWDYQDFVNLPEVQELEALPSNRCKTWVGDTLVIKVNGIHERYQESVYPI